MLINGKNYRSVMRDKAKVHIIDQGKLPFEFASLVTNNYRQTCDAIRRMAVRGAPAIGVAGGYAYVQAAYEFVANDFDAFKEKMKEAKAEILATRPTAVDLRNVLERMEAVCESGKDNLSCLKQLEKESEKIANEVVAGARMIGQHGDEIVHSKDRILTHCNTGALAAVDFGTALSVVRHAHNEGKDVFVYVDETRPRMQGALTSWELLQEGIRHTVIADNARGLLMQRKQIDLVIVGADRICANGDFANKIGTYEIAVLAKENKVPFYVAAPLTTFDLKCKSGKDIKIEERDGKEVLKLREIDLFPKGATAYNPAFDVTPAKYVTGYITERGIFKKVSKIFEEK